MGSVVNKVNLLFANAAIALNKFTSQFDSDHWLEENNHLPIKNFLVVHYVF